MGHGGLAERGNIFIASVDMTRMPMVVTDPKQAGDPLSLPTAPSLT